MIQRHELLQYCHYNLPFPILRQILDFAQIKPKFSKTAKKKLNTHFHNRFCQCCGEYLDFPTHRLYYTKKSPPRHVQCKTLKYRRVKERFYKANIRLDQFVSSEIIHRRYNVSCPIMIKLKSQRFFSEIEFIVKNNVIKRFDFYPVDMMYFHDPMIIEKTDFVVLPNLYNNNIDYQTILSEINIRDADSMVFHAQSCINHHTVSTILTHLLQNNRIFPFDPYQCELVEDIIRSEENFLLKKIMLSRMDMNGITIFHPEWMKEILMEYPEYIDNIKETILNDFFHQNYKWFFSKLCVYQPSIFKYIHFDTIK